MAIERYTINGDMTAYAAALEALGEDFFATVTGSASTLSAYDADEHLTFGVVQTASSTSNIAYRANDNYYGLSNPPKYLYKCGSNGAIITLSTPSAGAIAIAKDKNGRTAFAMCSGDGNLYPVCWGDGIGIENVNSNPITIALNSSASGSKPAIGYHCLFVPAPLLGTYEESNYFPKLFMMPLAQANMRGVHQIITDADGTEYFTNGYLALMDDSSETT